MKFIFSLFIAVSLFATTEATAQLRGDVSSPFDYRGQVINQNTVSIQSKLTSFFNRIDMSHSYSMSFSSFGGNYQNMNAYTNTLQMAVNDRLSLRADVSLMHSPFGSSNALGANFSEPKIMLSNAQLNYRLGEKSFITIQYQQTPYNNYFGGSPFGSPYGFMYDRAPGSNRGITSPRN